MGRLGRFLTVGALNTLVGLGVIFLSMSAFGFGLASANALGYAVGVALSFHLNRRWTFEHDGARSAAFARWLAVVEVSAGARQAVAAGARSVGVSAYAAQVIGVGLDGPA